VFSNLLGQIIAMAAKKIINLDLENQGGVFHRILPKFEKGPPSSVFYFGPRPIFEN